MYLIQFHEALNFLHVTFKGETSNSEIIAAYDEFLQRPLLPSKLKILSDYRQAMNDDEQVTDIYAIEKYISARFPSRFESVKWSNLTLLPRHTSLAFLFSRMLDLNVFDYGVFTTMERALDHLFIREEEFRLLESYGIIEKR